jgi:hypothetical protein
MEQAQQLLVDDAQGVLDLGITPAVRKTVMVPPPTAPALFRGSGDGPGRQACGACGEGAEDVLGAAV